MSDFEFWKDLPNIFDAIVNYQKKNVEFNNRFINPWIRLGNIFDRDDQHKEAVQAYRHAIEIDPHNSQNWADLGDALFKMAAYDDAAAAYKKAVELDPKAGWPVSNLALTLVTQGKCEEGIHLYLVSIDLLEEDKDKAVTWNRLGNAYRKLNDYENAFLAFQRADELDGENTGFSDQLDETTESNTMVAPEEVLVQMDVDQGEDLEEVVAEDSAESAPASDLPVEPITIPQNIDSITAQVSEESLPAAEQATQSVALAAGSNWPPDDIDLHQAVSLETKSEPLPSWLADENLIELIDEVVEEFVNEEARDESIATEEPVAEVPSESKKEQETPAAEVVKEVVEVQQNVSVNTSSTSMEMVETYTEFISIPVMPPPTLEDTQPIRVIKRVELSISEEIVEESPAQPEVYEETSEIAQEDSVEESIEAEESSSVRTSEAAYEEYLKDAVEPVSTLSDHIEDVQSGTPITKVSESGDVRIAMDTQNAHVWNELGNVYFNSGACDDAISAYGKAIELDRQFAWPYSNLALAYVQKERFAEATLLYQRSIELFASDKDKAVTWNRLGNVYRRLNDYSHAISAYQTADDLDPDNATLSLRSHYGLLGNLYMDQKPNYVL